VASAISVALVKLPAQIRQAIEAHARWAFPQEACGLLAADAAGRLRMAYCLTNVEANSSRFTVDPAEHFGAQSHAERQGWKIAGSFHSHPRSAAEPSAHDVSGALDPSWIYVIAGPVEEQVPVRAFRIRSGFVRELDMVATP
jgi:proteasome lid subunit RPN8/RPN11